MNKKLSVFLVDDHEIVRDGLKRLIETADDMEVIGEASTGSQAIAAVEELKPDVIVLDISIPEISGATAARRLKERSPASIILVLTVHEDTSYVRELIQAGATGYVLKRSASHELVQAIRAVARGNLYVDPHVAGKLVSALIPSRGRSSSNPFVNLSERESEVLRQIAQGYSNREIAEKLTLSTKTVETYKARSMEKLGLKSRVDLVRVAVERGWLREDDPDE